MHVPFLSLKYPDPLLLAWLCFACVRR
jgi:hypothetical protein